jgi:RNA polymerase sigma-54 factor
MVSLQPKLNLRVSQRQILTPGLVQMVSVLALNKLELKDMINAELVENPVLEELESSVPLLDDIAGKEEDREDREPAADDQVVQAEAEKKDPFDEIDFGSFFHDYLDPGYRSGQEIESIEKPSFENFLFRPSSLTDHLMWQLGSLQVSEEVREAAELVIGNLNEDGYLTATDEELLGVATEPVAAPSPVEPDAGPGGQGGETAAVAFDGIAEMQNEGAVAVATAPAIEPVAVVKAPVDSAPRIRPEALREALALVRHLDPVGVACRDLRECLLAQLMYLQQEHPHPEKKNGEAVGANELLADAIAIVDTHLKEVQNKQHKEIARALGRPLEAVTRALDFIRTLDPRPGQRYSNEEPRLIEPDVAFVKQGDEFLVMMNEDDVPQLRLNPAYKRLLQRDAAEKDVRNYVKERYKSAIQLIKNIEQRKQTIHKVCYAIIGRQRDFLDRGIDQLKPMMIKEVAEEIGVHPSTVSRAVANKYAHTPQGVFELRYFFSESVNGPEGAATSLLILKRRVKKLIDEEDPGRPLTDEQITRILQSQGIQVTRRTVAKYREDMRIPSTHQRRVKN